MKSLLIVVVCLALLSAGGWLIAWEWSYLHGRKQERQREWANQKVAGLVADARQHLLLRRWHAAADALKEAVAVPHATDLAEAQALLERARYQSSAEVAEGLWDEAGAALNRRDLAATRRALHAYLSHPQALRRHEVQKFSDELENAQAGARARELLRRLDDRAYEALAARGELPADLRPDHPVIRQLLLENLRRHLPDEARRRTELWQLHVRVRGHPLYREVQEFADRLRQKPQTSDAGDTSAALLRVLFRDLGIASPAEQKRLLEQLREPAESPATVIARKRGSLKARARVAEGLAADEITLLEQHIDRVLDRLQAELAEP